MKKILVLVAACLCFFVGCSPKISGNIQSGDIPEVHPDYAVVYIYRPGGFVQAPYNVYLGDQVVFRSKNKARAVIKVDKPGRYEIWGKTETRESLVLDIKPGEEYYVRSYVKFGVALWRPQFDLMPEASGRAEWDSIK
ncbi:MAG: hypothetical protein IJP93_04870 [Bacteroidales bacterium]|nr:hypothetical protein [Bacteroidales bacterium]MBR0083395.1 hypothetical protein [Bacteroidales bacterium]